MTDMESRAIAVTLDGLHQSDVEPDAADGDLWVDTSTEKRNVAVRSSTLGQWVSLVWWGPSRPPAARRVHGSLFVEDDVNPPNVWVHDAVNNDWGQVSVDWSALL